MFVARPCKNPRVDEYTKSHVRDSTIKKGRFLKHGDVGRSCLAKCKAQHRIVLGSAGKLGGEGA